MLKFLGWPFLYYFKLSPDSRPDAAQGFRGRVKTIPMREEKGEEVVASEFSPFVPCLNGCIGASPVGVKGKGSTETAGSDPWGTSVCMGSKGHDGRKISENEISG